MADFTWEKDSVVFSKDENLRCLTLNEKIAEEFTLVGNILEDMVKYSVAFFDAEDFEEDTKKPDVSRVAEICSNMQPLSSIETTKEKFGEVLTRLNIDKSIFSNFYLGCMSSVKKTSAQVDSIKGVIVQAAPFSFMASLLLGYVQSHTAHDPGVSQLLRQQRGHLLNLCRVLENAVKVNGWLHADLKSVGQRFEELKTKFVGLVDEYLATVVRFGFGGAHSGRGGPESSLSRHKQLIIDYQIVCEVEAAITNLRNEFWVALNKYS